MCVRDESRAASEQTIPCHEVWRYNVHVPIQLEDDVSGVNSRDQNRTLYVSFQREERVCFEVTFRFHEVWRHGRHLCRFDSVSDVVCSCTQT